MNTFRTIFQLLGVVIITAMTASFAHAEAGKPNILVVWGDDVGQSNISAYTHGMVGYKTPNIDHAMGRH